MPLPHQISDQDAYQIARSNQFGLGWYDPSDLLSFKRFDIGAKYIYGRLRDIGAPFNIYSRIYREHLHIWNGFFEEMPSKNSFEDFHSAFDLVLDATQRSSSKGLASIIPLADDLHPVNGAHRLTAALVHNRLALAAPLNIAPEYSTFDYRFFRSLVDQRVEFDQTFDEMALTLARLKSRFRMVTLFDPPNDIDGVLSLVREFGDIVYSQYRTFNPTRGQNNLIATIYEGEPWLGDPLNGFPGADDKAGRCFVISGNALFLLFDPHHDKQVSDLKAELRKVFDRDKDSVHINDTHRETIRIAEIAFHEPSAAFLNARRQGLLPNLGGILPDYIRLTSFQPESFCIDGGGVLAAYGIRDCDDIDYIHFKVGAVDNCNGMINSHNDYLRYYAKPPADLVFDSENYFYFRGVKWVSLQHVQDWKASRAETKDVTDIDLISKFRTS